MKALFLVISVLWVLPGVYHSLSVPVQSTLLVEGVSHRQQRAKNDTLRCEEHQYRPKGKPYCCPKCHAGYKVKEDCKEAGQISVCEPCETNRFTDVPNGAKRCEGCSSCLTQMNQIVLFNCTRYKDTQCGCADGHFIKRQGGTFTCQECSQCQNGTVAAKCQGEQNTVCSCHHKFFPHSVDGTCRPCDECDNTDCEDLCPRPHPVGVVNPRDNKDGLLWLAVAAAIGAAVIAVVGIGGVYHYYRKKATSSSSSSSLDITESSTQSESLISNNNEIGNTTKRFYLPGQPKLPMTVEENSYTNGYTVVHGGNIQCSKDILNMSLPLPDITNTTASPHIESLQVTYAIIESVPVRQWREFARRLGLSDHVIDTSEHNHRLNYKDSQYEMLRVWISREGSPTAKRDQLFNVLREMHLGGCIEKIEEHL